MNRWILFPVLLAMLAVVACGGGGNTGGNTDGSDPVRAARNPVDVELRTAALETVPQMTQITGHLEPLRTVSPGTKIMGRIASVRFREGDQVAKGQLLASLESRDLQAAVGQAQAAVRLVQAQLENARAQHRRIADLHSRGSVTDKNLEDATAGFQVAEAALDQAQANLTAAEVMLSYAEIRSPISGWIAERRVEAGDMASPGQPLFTLEDLSEVLAVAQVPESDIVGMELGDNARVTVLDRQLEATVDHIVPAGDPKSRTFTVKLRLSNAEGALKSGMFVRVSLARGERQILRVPEPALVERGQLEGLWIAAEDKTLHLRWIKTGQRRDGFAEVLSGLDPEELYVLQPGAGWIDGDDFVETR